MSAAPSDLLEIVMASLKQMEATLLGMKQMRQYFNSGPARDLLDRLIEEAESQIVAIKQSVIQ